MTDEIAHIMHIFGKFRYQRLSELGNRLLKEGLEAQRRITGTNWGVFRCLGFTECVPHATFTLVLANSSRWKLSSREVIVLDEQNGKILLPYRKIEDFFAFASLLKIESLHGYAALVSFTQPTYYDFEKLSPPVQIRNEADADAADIEFLEEYQSYTEGITTLWWGCRWETLFTLTVDLTQTPPFMKVTFVA